MFIYSENLVIKQLVSILVLSTVQDVEMKQETGRKQERDRQNELGRNEAPKA
jgi:hypothetical protein